MPSGRACCIKDAAAEIDFTCPSPRVRTCVWEREGARARTGATPQPKPSKHVRNTRPETLNPKLETQSADAHRDAPFFSYFYFYFIFMFADAHRRHARASGFVPQALV